jgi:S1-C subfamily serine protease
MNKIVFFLFALMCSLGAYETETVITTDSADVKTEEVRSSMRIIEQKVRAAAVKVSTAGGGHGSGSVVRYKDISVVFTAQHVADGMVGDFYKISKNDKQTIGMLVYSDPVHDIAMIYMPKDLQTVAPMKFAPTDEIIKVGTEITYSGYPSDHRLMTFNGKVAGYEFIPGRGIQIILHTHGWFGSSGSGVYDSKGRMVGILWGIDVESRPTSQVVENIIWISPINNVQMKYALSVICVALEGAPKACK